MKFMCLSGKIISDSTDFISNKARLIADEDWERFLDSTQQPEGHNWHLETDIYQCPDCGCLRIEKSSGHVVFFKPEDHTVSRSLLRSVGLTPHDTKA